MKRERGVWKRRKREKSTVIHEYTVEQVCDPRTVPQMMEYEILE
jgi:hypothetical protein